MLFWSGPTQQKYSQAFLKIFIFSTLSDPIRHFFQNHPKPIRKRPQTTPRHIPRHPKIDEKVTPKRPSGSRESNRRPPDSRSEDQPTRVFWPHKTAPLRVSYVSKIQSLYVKIPECARAHGFSAAKIAPALFFRSQNSPPKVFPRPKQPAHGFPQPK